MKNNEIESIKSDLQQQQANLPTTPRVKQSLVEQLNNSSDVCINQKIIFFYYRNPSSCFIETVDKGCEIIGRIIRERDWNLWKTKW